MDAVSRGSELHCFLAARILFREIQGSATAAVPAERESVGDASPDGGRPEAGTTKEDVANATKDCQLAHVARYGRLPTDRMISVFRHSEVIGRDYL